MIIVTGGAGFIGSNFLHHLTRVTDEEVVVLDNITYAANESYIPSQHKFMWCDISDAEHVEYIFIKFKPTKVFNFAAESHVDNSIKNPSIFLEKTFTTCITYRTRSYNSSWSICL